MRKTKMKRLAALAKVQENHRKHVEDYREAFELYKVEVAAQLERNKANFEKESADLLERVLGADLSKGQPAVGAVLPAYILSFGHLKVPVSHAKDYEQVIMMLEMEVEDLIELDSDQFACFIMDDWDWKAEFRNTSEFYKNNAAKR